MATLTKGVWSLTSPLPVQSSLCANVCLIWGIQTCIHYQQFLYQTNVFMTIIQNPYIHPKLIMYNILHKSWYIRFQIFSKEKVHDAE